MKEPVRQIESFDLALGSFSRKRFKALNRYADGIFTLVCRVAAILPVIALISILVALLFEAMPAIKLNGLYFFFGSTWKPGNFYANGVVTNGVSHPPGSLFGALPLITGTVFAAFIAIVIAIPVSIGSAILIVEKLPKSVSSFVGVCLEVLAGVPSVVFGLWGALTLGPFLAHHVTPFISRTMPNVVILNYFKGNTGAGEGLLSSGIVLAIMVIPIIASTTRELFRQVPTGAREGATALGMTDFEVVRKIDLKWVGSGIFGASVLGLGRALGETMAVAMVSGSIMGAYPKNIYSTMSTIAATIVSQLDSYYTDSTGFAVATLAEASLMLMLISLVVNLLARRLVRRVSKTALPVGRGV